ncbi:MAG: type II toxin-antitoxin system VapC family toxin [Pseudolysinimonas sp.]
MIGLDTNVLMRDSLGDDKVQSTLAKAAISRLTFDDPGFVSVVTLVECAWVLRRSAKRSPAEIARYVRGLLAAREIVVQASDSVRRAVRDAEEHGTEFADALIAQLAIDAGCDYILTLDKRAAELPGMRLLEA